MTAGLVIATTPAQAQPEGPRARLLADADGSLAIRPGFLGVPDDSRVDNPTVTRRTGVVAAARAHLARYGGLVGADSTHLRPSGTDESVTGRPVVRFAQEVGGLPVIGGEVVVTLGNDRELDSLLATTSTRSGTLVRPAAVPEAAAKRAARTLVSRLVGRSEALTASSAGRRLFDPAVFGEAGEPRSVWQVEVTGGPAVRRLVLVDDQTAAVALQIDQIQTLDRVVCDNADVRRRKEIACSSGFARTETSSPSAVADVEQAFEFGGDVATFYDEIGGLDLTDRLGIDVAGTKKLAATVRWCTKGDDCPYLNAFWDGHQMYYGNGFTAAEDVVGHEMTHGLIDQYAHLFYWGQSGAINESMADVMGEILDHRVPSPGDSPDSWSMGEDLAHIGLEPARDLADPPSRRQPDRMTSKLYTADLKGPYNDNGGVHTNSGVGNKTAYLISQGGTFNGQTITGIDGDDLGLTKTATLYLAAIQTLSSGSDYADLADVLEQRCQELVGTRGFTETDCTNIAKATAATELRTTPPAAPQPADAPLTCPLGDEPVVLLDSETGDPAATMTAGKGWARGTTDGWGPNAVSGDSWSAATSWTQEGMRPSARSLTAAGPLALPAGRLAYLRFQGWHLLDWGSLNNRPKKTRWFDGGTVEVRTGGRWADAATLPWVNGPKRTIFQHFGNPAAGRKAFAGDSSGWVASRADLSEYAGSSVRPRFTMNFDNGGTFLGWYLDDVSVYTCDAAGSVSNTGRPTVAGKARVGKTLRARASAWSDSSVSLAYQWLRGGTPIAGATGQRYALVKRDRGQRISVRVTAHHDGYLPGIATSTRTSKVRS